ncbi:hypothetical protein EDB87DRAFT_1620894 [Lactarius vividus]|nr:hypothetical protein EDB87DRAFT_1620894 [Lactarius vividus]
MLISSSHPNPSLVASSFSLVSVVLCLSLSSSVPCLDLEHPLIWYSHLGVPAFHRIARFASIAFQHVKSPSMTPHQPRYHTLVSRRSTYSTVPSHPRDAVGDCVGYCVVIGLEGGLLLYVNWPTSTLPLVLQVVHWHVTARTVWLLRAAMIEWYQAAGTRSAAGRPPT